VELLLKKAASAWDDVSATPRYEGVSVSRPNLPIFYAPETYEAIPLVARIGKKFVVLADSQEAESAIRNLLERMDISRNQYRIWRLNEEFDLARALLRVEKEFPSANPFLVKPTPSWFQDLLKLLEEEGIIPIGHWDSALESTRAFLRAA